jgi:hypothetical protein
VEVGLLVTPEDRARVPGNIKQVSKDASAVEMARVVAFMVDARLRNYPMSPQEALNKVRGVVGGKLKAVVNPSPECAVRAIEADPFLKRYAGLARAHDFSSETRPPEEMYRKLGGDDGEREKHLKRLQRLARKQPEAV